MNNEFSVSRVLLALALLLPASSAVSAAGEEGPTCPEGGLVFFSLPDGVVTACRSEYDWALAQTGPEGGSDQVHIRAFDAGAGSGASHREEGGSLRLRVRAPEAEGGPHPLALVRGGRDGAALPAAPCEPSACRPSGPGGASAPGAADAAPRREPIVARELGELETVREGAEALKPAEFFPDDLPAHKAKAWRQLRGIVASMKRHGQDVSGERNVIVDKDGNVVATMTGDLDWDWVRRNVREGETVYRVDLGAPRPAASAPRPAPPAAPRPTPRPEPEAPQAQAVADPAANCAKALDGSVASRLCGSAPGAAAVAAGVAAVFESAWRSLPSLLTLAGLLKAGSFLLAGVAGNSAVSLVARIPYVGPIVAVGLVLALVLGPAAPALSEALSAGEGTAERYAALRRAAALSATMILAMVAAKGAGAVLSAARAASASRAAAAVRAPAPRVEPTLSSARGASEVAGPDALGRLEPRF